MIVQPLGSRVLVKPVAPDEKTPGGIIMPGTVQADMFEGVVVDVGCWKTGASVTIGDTILYPRGHGRQVDIDGIKHFVLDTEHVVAKVIRKEEGTLN